MITLTEIKRKYYLDSVALMRHSKVIAELDNIDEAAMMMGTPANLQIMFNAGLLESAEQDVDGGDLIISVRSSDESNAKEALAQAGILLQLPKSSGGGSMWQPRSIRSAADAMPNANLALISVPGEFAISEARKAIRRGMHAMIFSDNVPLVAEIALKREAASLGRLVMGPDCGTAIINGVPLAFANRVKRGSVGIVGASGTGIQEVSCLIHQAGLGVSHAIGVGGRDLSQGVGGISSLMALDLLARDESTSHIVLISKPPATTVVTDILDKVRQINKPCTLCFVGLTEPSMPLPASAQWATTLREAAEIASGVTLFDAKSIATNMEPDIDARQIVGLYTGGTLCGEAQVILKSSGMNCMSNAPIPGSGLIDAAKKISAAGISHALIDLGADEFTRGRPHPMIEPAVRDQPLIETAGNKNVAVILLDLVIGYGSHPDPANHLAKAVRQLKRKPVLIASVTGTDEDPQSRSRQLATLHSAGIHTAYCNAAAVEMAIACLKQTENVTSSV